MFLLFPHFKSINMSRANCKHTDAEKGDNSGNEKWSLTVWSSGLIHAGSFVVRELCKADGTLVRLTLSGSDSQKVHLHQKVEMHLEVSLFHSFIHSFMHTHTCVQRHHSMCRLLWVFISCMLLFCLFSNHMPVIPHSGLQHEGFFP